MYDQPTLPESVVYGVYKVISYTCMYPDTWYEQEALANQRKKQKEQAGQGRHKVIKTTYEQFINDLRSAS